MGGNPMTTNHPVVIVTGASRGLGAAVARWLAKAGAAVTLVARSEEKLMEVAADVRRLGGNAQAFKADLSDSHACRGAVETTLDHFGRIDSLVNNAGVVQPLAPIADTHPEEGATTLKSIYWLPSTWSGLPLPNCAGTTAGS